MLTGEVRGSFGGGGAGGGEGFNLCEGALETGGGVARNARVRSSEGVFKDVHGIG